MDDAMPQHPYRRLALMAVLSFLFMYGLMYMMVDEVIDIVPNVNQLYMAAMMTAPMIVLEVMLMGAMYPNEGLNGGIVGASAVVGILCIAGIRSQAGVTDERLLESMIPHHSGAIRMCEEAELDDPEVRALCREIIDSQREEIAWMRARLEP